MLAGMYSNHVPKYGVEYAGGFHVWVMFGNQITYCLEEGLHEYQADELTSHLNQCLSDWHTWMVRHIVWINFLLNALQKPPAAIDLIWKKISFRQLCFPGDYNK